MRWLLPGNTLKHPLLKNLPELTSVAFMQHLVMRISFHWTIAISVDIRHSIHYFFTIHRRHDMRKLLLACFFYTILHLPLLDAAENSSGCDDKIPLKQHNYLLKEALLRRADWEYSSRHSFEPQFPWQTHLLIDMDKSLKSSLQEQIGDNMIYTTRFLNAWGSGFGFVLRPAVTLGYLTQNIDETTEFQNVDSWEQDVYMGMFQVGLRLEYSDFGFGIIGGGGPAYYDYSKYVAGTFERTPVEESEAFGFVYTAAVEASIQIVVLRISGQIRYVHTPGIQQDLVFPAVGFQTRSGFLSFLPWVFFL